MPDNEELENFKPLESREKVHIANISISYKQKKGMETSKFGTFSNSATFGKN